MPVYAYRFYDENKKAAKYWRDIGTLDAYYEANMDLCHVNPEFNLYDPEWPLRTHQVQAPPAKFVFADEGRRCGQALDSIISAGCIISGSRITGSVLCPNVRVHSFCDIEQSILMPGVRVGRHARIRRAIVDRDVLHPARRADRLQRGGGSAPPHRHATAASSSSHRRRAVHRRHLRGGAAERSGVRQAGSARNHRQVQKVQAESTGSTGYNGFVRTTITLKIQRSRDERFSIRAAIRRSKWT